MAKPELGLKRTCVSCGTKFYDLMKAPAQCPKCGTEQPAELPRNRRPGGNAAESKAKRPAVVEPTLEDAEVEVEVAETEEDAVLEDADDLEADADDLGAELEVDPPADEEER